jgi:hypothetical protein
MELITARMMDKDMQAYKDLNRELADPWPDETVRGPERHPDATRESSRVWHGHVGAVHHIPLADMQSDTLVFDLLKKERLANEQAGLPNPSLVPPKLPSWEQLPQGRKLLEKWKAARDDLNLEIVTPYEVEVGNNLRVHAESLVKYFGGKNGTLIFTNIDAFRPVGEELCDQGYGISVLDEPTSEANELYNRDLFINLLSEWEWTGDDRAKPDWLISPREAAPESDDEEED